MSSKCVFSWNNEAQIKSLLPFNTDMYHTHMRGAQLLTIRFTWGKPRPLKPSTAAPAPQPYGSLLHGQGPCLPLELQAQSSLMKFTPSTGFWCGFSTIRCSDAQVPHLSQMSQYKEPHALGQTEVTGLTEVELKLQRKFKGAALLQNLKFIIFQTKLMSHIHLCAYLYPNTGL